jgi:hypothetical protein
MDGGHFRPPTPEAAARDGRHAKSWQKAGKKQAFV